MNAIHVKKSRRYHVAKIVGLILFSILGSALCSFAASPTLTGIEGSTLAYNEGQAATIITTALNVGDIDSPTLPSAIVKITGNFLNTEDVLTFVNNFGITGSYDAATGTLTLTGPATLLNFRNALRSITYTNTNTNNPSTLPRTISFTVNDGTTNSNTSTRNISVAAVNDAPVANSVEGATLSYTEDDPATILTNTIAVQDVDNVNLTGATVQITGNFNAAQDVLAFTNAFGISGSFAGSTLTLTGTVPVANYEAALRTVTYRNTNTVNPSTLVRTVTFRVNDGSALSVAVTRTITISLVNDAPALNTIESTALSYSEGQAATSVTGTLIVADGDSPNLTGGTVQITGNFIQTEDVLSFSNSGGVTGVLDATTGTVTFSGTGTLATYQTVLRSVKYRNSNNNTPSPLTRTVSFTVTDGSLSSTTVTRNITVIPVNDAPVAVNDAITTPEELAVDINVIANDTDVDNALDPTSVTIITNPVNGIVSVNATTGVVTYTPNAEFSGNNTFTYKVKDVSGTLSNTATVTVTVSLINDAPSFTVGPNITVAEDAGTVSFPAWATNINDGDPFTSQGLTFIIANSNSALFASGPSINSSGTLSFKPKDNLSGVANLTVYLQDNGLATPPPNVNISGTQTFTITVTSVNDAPVGVDESFSTSSNTPLTADAKGNDKDLENNATTLSAVPLVPPAHGTVVINANGTFTYSPAGNFTGTDGFTYQICDDGNDNGVPASRCGQGVVTITVNPPNANWNIVGNNSIELAPNAFLLTQALNNQQGAIWNRKPLDLHFSFDLDLNAIFSTPGVAHDDGADGIVFVFQRDLTPPPLNVPDLPIYARGTNGGSLGVGGITPSLAIEVDTYQNAGEEVYDHIAVNKDGDVWNNLAAPVPAKLDGGGLPVDIEDGVWHAVNIHWDYPTKTLRIKFDGVDKIVYADDIVASIFSGDPSGVYWGFSSSTGGKNNYQAVSDIVMTVINLSPVAGADVGTTDEDAALNGTTVLVNDSDPEGGVLSVLAETKATPHGQVVIKADGTYTYTPVADYNGTDTFSYQVCDDFSPNGCSTGTVTVTINPVQDAPVGHPDNFTTTEDTDLVVTCDCVLHNDIDPDGEVLTATIVTPTTHGTLDFHPDGTFTYHPNQDFFGTDTFSYQATDGKDQTAVTVATIVVLPVNDPPIAFPDVVTVLEDTPTALPILANDIDVDDTLIPTQVTIVHPPDHGTITVSATGILYTPQPNYFGPDAFTYTVTDASHAVSNIATVTITVQPVNDAPIAAADIASTMEDQPVTVDVLVNDSDVDNSLNTGSVVVVTAPAHGTAKVQPNGTVIYTPEKDFNGSDSFEYTVKDVAGAASAPALVTISVTPVNDAPVAVNDNVTTLENTSIAIAVLANDYDVDNPLVPASLNIITSTTRGSVNYDPSTGVATYSPATDDVGDFVFTYTIQDADGLMSNTATVKITVVPPNRAPHAVDDGPIALALLLDLPIDVLENDYDTDNTNDELTIVSVTQPNVGSVAIVDGKIIYTPEGTISGTVTFTYTISDPAGLTDEAVVTIDYTYNPLEVSEGFSPNNDANNDTWYIRSIENYPNNQVKIFDRWGLIVYQKQHYENSNAPWDGRANTGQQSGKLLDQGTYYYLLDVGGELKQMSGYVMIVR